MPVLLASSRHLPPPERYQVWCAVSEPYQNLPAATRWAGRDEALGAAYDAIQGAWLALGRRLGAERTGDLSHAAACAANASDLGLMLAWTRLVQDEARAPATLLVVCDDPWLFRHLARLLPVAVSPPPPLHRTEARLALRGAFARLRYALRALVWAVRYRGDRTAVRPGAPALLVYGHPDASHAGRDGYFGRLMDRVDGLERVVHVDRAPALAHLTGPSLNAWGPASAALRLAVTRWRPKSATENGPLRWLVRRAAALEGGTAQAAAIRWQQVCQRAWLSAARPGVVAWPWENHAWERDLVRACRTLGVGTVGYQHSTIADREWNYDGASNPDGADSLPQNILAAGPATRKVLEAMEIPRDRIRVGGALRRPDVPALAFDPGGPVLLALPSDRRIAAQMMAAAEPVAAAGAKVLVRAHPMYPFAPPPGSGLEATDRPLEDQDGLSAVVFAGTSVGLDALLGGLPVIRFRPEGIFAAETIPAGVPVPEAGAGDLAEVLKTLGPPPALDPALFHAVPDWDLWHEVLRPDPAR